MNTQKKIFAVIIAIAMMCSSASALLNQAKREQSFTVGKNSSAEVSVTGGDILIKTWEKNEVKVVVDGIDDSDMEYVKMSQSGDEIRVSYKPKWGSSSGGTFTLTVPTQCKVNLRTSGGDLELTGNLTADAKGSTSGGNISIERVKGNVSMSTSGGNINTGDIDGKADLRTSGGNITLATVNGEANVSTSGGDIRIGKVGKKLDARTSGGDIEVGDIGGDANLSTAGGDLRIGKVSGSATVRTSGGDIDLKGASGSVVAKTSGGDVSLANIDGTVDASTAGGDISADITPGGKGGSKLRSSGGDIRLSIPSTAKVTIDATIRIQPGWGSTKKYEIRSDFKADSHDKNDDEIRARYILNGGGETIELITVNGYIDIRKSK